MLITQNFFLTKLPAGHAGLSLARPYSALKSGRSHLLSLFALVVSLQGLSAKSNAACSFQSGATSIITLSPLITLISSRLAERLGGRRSVVALDSSSTATGIGVQLLDNTGMVFPLGTYRTFANYNSFGGSFTIPFQVRYYKIASTIGAGTAKTSMTFTMNYQ